MGYLAEMDGRPGESADFFYGKAKEADQVQPGELLMPLERMG